MVPGRRKAGRSWEVARVVKRSGDRSAVVLMV